MAPLADNKRELAILEEIEGLTSARQSLRLPIPGGLDPDELLTEAAGYGWTYVNAAFCYTRATGNRFNGPERGAWYASYGEAAIETAQSEAAWHLARELSATGVFENVTLYREILAGFTTRFHDLNGKEGETVLSPDPGTAYHAGQALARDVFRSGGNGLLYPSARNRSGHCLAALRPHLVQNIRQGARWEFKWAGTAKPGITKA